MTQKILLIEDEESLNRGISLKLAREGYEVYSAATLDQADRLFAAKRPELVICDVGLPDGDGFEFCRRLRRQSKVLFLFLTALDTELDIVNGYDAGADDYMTKPFSLMVLLSKVNAMLRRSAAKTQEQPRSILSGDIRLFPEELRVQKGGAFLSLTPKEWKLLWLFMENPKHILSKEQLLNKVWDVDSEFVDENTVAVNIRRLRGKIEDDPSSPSYIKNVWGMGYIWERSCIEE